MSSILAPIKSLYANYYQRIIQSYIISRIVCGSLVKFSLSTWEESVFIAHWFKMNPRVQGCEIWRRETRVVILVGNDARTILYIERTKTKPDETIACHLMLPFKVIQGHHTIPPGNGAAIQQHRNMTPPPIASGVFFWHTLHTLYLVCLHHCLWYILAYNTTL